MTEIRLLNLYKGFFVNGVRKEILNNVSLDINQGDFILIQGNAGVGKSTFLMIVGGLLSPDSGTIYINKHNLSKISSRQKEKLRVTSFQYIFQNSLLLPDYTVLENILFPLQTLGKIDKKVFKKAFFLLEYFKIIDIAGKKMRYASGGETQLVSFIRAVLSPADILLADEPTSELDRELTHKIFDFLKKLNHEKNTTILLVSHDEDAQNYAKESYTLVQGKLSAYKKLNHS